MDVILGGDLMLGRGVSDVVREKGPAYPLESISHITRSGDLFLANLECAITDRPISYSGPPKAFYFKADPDAAEVLVKSGVDFVSLANNHALDGDYAGLMDTLAVLDEKGISHAGAGENLRSAVRPAFLEAKGLRFGIIACCDHQADFAAGADRPGIYFVDVRSPDSVSGLIKHVEDLEPRVDHVVVSFHWQENWVDRISSSYRELARNLIEAGASVVWGHSPHHFLGVEWFKNSVVIYSAGNLIDDYATNPQFRNDLQLLFRASFEKDRISGIDAYPVELEFGCVKPAGEPARKWIGELFSEQCFEVGSRVSLRDDYFVVYPE